MRCLVAIFTLVLLSVEARANEPDVRSVIDRCLTFLAKDHLAWMESKKYYSYAMSCTASDEIKPHADGVAVKLSVMATGGVCWSPKGREIIK